MSKAVEKDDVGDKADLESVAEWDDGVAGEVARMLLQSSTEANSE